MMLLMLQRNHSAKPRPYELKDGAVTDTQLFEIRRRYAGNTHTHTHCPTWAAQLSSRGERPSSSLADSAAAAAAATP
jgi:hypothetical protein